MVFAARAEASCGVGPPPAGGYGCGLSTAIQQWPSAAAGREEMRNRWGGQGIGVAGRSVGAARAVAAHRHAELRL